ncbi:MAG: cation transporting ATPase C-terminal domain-containing protein [Desulfobacterales bacterium]
MDHNWNLVLGVLAAQGIHLLSMYLPFMQTILTTAPVSFSQWMSALTLACVILVVMEIFKWVKRRQALAV